MARETFAPKTGRPPVRKDVPIRVPLPADELIGDILKAGPHPMERPERKVSKTRGKTRPKA